MKHQLLCACLIMLVSNFPTPGQSQSQFPRIDSIEYSSASVFSIGDGVDLNRLETPIGNCIDLANSPIQEDVVNGTVSITSDVSVSTSIEELERKSNFSMAIEAALKGDYVGVAKGSVETKYTKSFEKFLQSEKSSLLVNVSIVADHGRRWLDYKLKDQYAKMLADGEFSEFREICGTHFIRAEQRQARLDFQIVVSGLSQTEKEILKKMAETKVSASGTFSKVFSASAKGGVKKETEKFLKTALELGNVSISSQLLGASGINALADTLKIPKVTSPDAMSSFFSGLSTVAKSFEESNGVPSKYLILAYPGLPTSNPDAEKFYFKGAIFRKLLITENGINANLFIRENLPDLWQDYMQTEHANLNALSDKLSTMLLRCENEGACDATLPSDPSPLTLEDVLYDGSLRGICGNDIQTIAVKDIMSDLAIYWRGHMRYPNYISLSDTKAFYLDKEFNRVNLTPFDYGYDFSVEPNVLAANGLLSDGSRRKGPGRAILQLINESLEPDLVAPNGKMDANFISDYRSKNADHIFGLSFRFSNGWVVDQLLGRADMRQCAAISG